MLARANVGWLVLNRLAVADIREDAEQLEFAYLAGENEKWYNHSEKTVWHFLMKLNTYPSTLQLYA